jgi:hypothetical protein
MVGSAWSFAVWRGLENILFVRARGVAGFANKFGVLSPNTGSFAEGSVTDLLLSESEALTGDLKGVLKGERKGFERVFEASFIRRRFAAGVDITRDWLGLADRSREGKLVLIVSHEYKF